MGFYMEIFEARVLGENLYLHQRFTQCSKWSTSCILFRSCCNILHPTIKYVMPVEGEGGGDTSINALGGSFILVCPKPGPGLPISYIVVFSMLMNWGEVR
jgi:hypothetical protein